MNRPNLLIIGAGGVGSVVAHKAVQFGDEFGEISLASRSPAKVESIAADVAARQPAAKPVHGFAVDARDQAAVERVIRNTGAGIVLNVASSYCNPAILDACLATGAHYVDTALAEDENIENILAPWYSYHEWPRMPRFEEKGISALLGMGFDPGASNIFCAYAKKHHFDAIETIDIIDVNGGDHGRYFATNFNAEINLREVKEDVIYWQDGAFHTIPHHSRAMEVTLPEVGTHKVYSMGHDELQSLPYSFPEARRVEFWMGFSDKYLAVFEVLDRLGFTSSIPVDVDGRMIAPNRMAKAVLPDPASLAAGYKGEVCIGVDIRGRKNGEERRLFVYSNCDHEKCYAEVGSQAISYTTGVPVVAAARLLANGAWAPRRMVHVETLDPDPFMEMMPQMGIGWHARELPLDGSWPF